MFSNKLQMNIRHYESYHNEHVFLFGEVMLGQYLHLFLSASNNLEIHFFLFKTPCCVQSLTS